MPRLEHVQSVERTFAIIEALKERGALGIAELAAQLSLDRSTVHRLLSTLRHLGYVNQDPETLKYSNSLKFFDIGNSAQRSFGLAVT
ncbi:MAG: helix-turn-helix domain-containing protein, partial [Pyramidobacter sp.]|nr:helix-turn-helix domain-containing protein [Pyramidobacter sp.]